MPNGKFQKYDYFKGLEKIGYPDYHNHLGGVLPYKKLRDFYLENYSVSRTKYGYECSRLSVGDKMNFKKFESGVGLFLRTTYHLLVEKYDFTIRSSAPMRGAHAVMLSVFYLFLFAAKAGIINAVDLEYVEKTLQEPKDIEPLLKEYLSKCYIWLGSAKDVPRECKSVARRAFMNCVRATRYTPFDDGYVGRSAYLEIFDNKEKIGVEKYGMRSLEWLYKEEKTRYVEMSQSQKKIPKGARSKGYNWCKWLLLTANHREILAGKKEFRAPYWNKLVSALENDPHYVGIDLAGPEGYWYKSANTKTLVNHLLPLLQKQAETRQRKYKAPKVVFRPHVGEGSSVLDQGASLVELAPVAFLKGAIEGALRKRAKDGPVKGVTSDFLDWLDKDYVSKLGKTREVRDFKIYKRKI